MKVRGREYVRERASSLNAHVQQHLFINCLSSNSKSVSKSNMGVLIPTSVGIGASTIGSYIVTGRTESGKFRFYFKKQKEESIISIVKLALLDLLNFSFSGSQYFQYGLKQSWEDLNGKTLWAIVQITQDMLILFGASQDLVLWFAFVKKKKTDLIINTTVFSYWILNT